ncbi:hypothetical protein FSP39_021241 [Pinctada imbricata]|uniref:Caveolin n=1 Tax=Pinctada imbricata TaxID=66713 RepID=A0AA89C2M5_PINIB|nr:hypothetical protein FSP39_021241 [Pinctada imbricata]
MAGSEESASNVRLTIGNEQVDTADVTKGQEIDLKDRDPENLNEDFKVQFHDIIGEPEEGVFSFDKIWIYSFKTYTNTKLWCYRITTLICGIPVSFCWGIYFACLAFNTIWICIPAVKAYNLKLRCAKGCFDSLLEAFVRPCYEASGYIFYNIRIFKGQVRD